MKGARSRSLRVRVRWPWRLARVSTLHRLLAMPGGWGAKAVAEDERLASLRAYTNPSDTPEEAVDRKARYKKLQDAAAKKPWGKGKWPKADAAADKPAGKSKAAQKRARAAAKKAGAKAAAKKTKRVSFTGVPVAPVAGAAVAGTNGVIKAHIDCHKCGRKGHFADKCGA